MQCPDRERLSALSQGLVTGRELETLAAHVVGCDRCHDVLASLEPWATPDARFYLPTTELVHAVVSGSDAGLAARHVDPVHLHAVAIATEQPRGGEPALSSEELAHLTDCDICQLAFETTVLGAPAGNAYLPSEPLVLATVGISFRWPPFRFFHPNSPVARMRTERRTLTTSRAAAVLLAATGFSPASLAAATVVHVAALVLAGIWMSGQPGLGMSALDPLRQRTTVQEHPLFFAVPSRTAVAPSRPASVARIPGSRAVTPPGVDSAVLVQERVAQLAARQWEERERAINRILVFERDQGIRTGNIREQLQNIAEVLGKVPDVRIRLEVEAVRDAQPLRGTALGLQDAEEVRGFLKERGVASERITIGVAEDLRSACASNERECLILTQRVRVVVVR